jgi:ATP-binding cassette subfamily G (WHITE) protein 2 (PDR)
MYRVSPLTYLSSAMMSAGIANKAVTCSDIEVLRVTPPYNISCESYLAPFREYTGASIISTDRDKSCDVCPLGTANAFLDSIGSRYEERWRNLGIFVVFIVLNIVGTFALHWLTRVPKKRKKKV